MSNLHAISSRALTNRSGARKFNIYSVYNELQQWNAFVDKPLKSHDVIVFHKDNRFSYIHSPLAPVPLLLWRYISCHRLDFTPRVTMSLTQIYIKFRTNIFTLLQPNCSPNATQWYDFVDEKKILNLRRFSQLSQSHFVCIMVYPLEIIDFVIDGAILLCSRCIPDLNDR